MEVIKFPSHDIEIIRQAALLLVEGFKDHWPHAWPDIDSALEEVQEALQPGRIALAAFGDDGTLLGWIGAISEYDGNAWELHPLVVHPAKQGCGIGSALVSSLEMHIAERGGVTIYLGTDDEDNMTTLSGVDLFPNPIRHIENIENLRRHPFEFYQKMGFTIVGVIPDANGPGKPDILMAKRVSPAVSDR